MTPFTHILIIIPLIVGWDTTSLLPFLPSPLTLPSLHSLCVAPFRSEGGTPHTLKRWCVMHTRGRREEPLCHGSQMCRVRGCDFDELCIREFVCKEVCGTYDLRPGLSFVHGSGHDVPWSVVVCHAIMLAAAPSTPQARKKRTRTSIHKKIANFLCGGD